MDLPQQIDPPVARLRAALFAAGLRVTRQRLAVYRQLLTLNHPTAEEVYRRVRIDEAAVSLATTYKALDALVLSGLATKMMTNHGSSRYDARSDHHYHLICSRTGNVVDLDTRYDPELITRMDPELVDDLGRRGFHVTGYRLEVVGYFDEVSPDRPDSEPCR